MKDNELTFRKGDSNYENIAIVIHGINLNVFASGFTEKIEHLIGVLEDKYKSIAVFKYNFKTRGKYSAEILAEEIYKKINNSSKIDIYGHSKGGLIALLCSLLYFNNSSLIRSVTQICSPNNFAGKKFKNAHDLVIAIRKVPNPYLFISNGISYGFDLASRKFIGIRELYDTKDKDSICNLISKCNSNFNNKTNYVSIGSIADKTVPVSNCQLKSELPNVTNLYFDIKEKRYEHGNIVGEININRLKYTLTSLYKNNFKLDKNIFHFNNKCSNGDNIEDEDIKKLINSNTFKICNHCIGINN